MLLPALGKARETAYSASCLNKLKNIGLAVTMYAGDNHEYFPGLNTGSAPFYTEISPYLKSGNTVASFQIFICPADRIRLSYNTDDVSRKRSYTLNTNMTHEHDGNPPGDANNYNFAWCRLSKVSGPRVKKSTRQMESAVLPLHWISNAGRLVSITGVTHSRTDLQCRTAEWTSGTTERQICCLLIFMQRAKSYRN